MTNMAQTDSEIKTLLRSLPSDMTSTGRLAAILEKVGVTTTQEISELCGITRRMAQYARQEVRDAAEGKARVKNVARDVLGTPSVWGY